MKRRGLFVWSITAAMAGFLFGFDAIVISGAEQKIQLLWNLRPGMHGLCTSAALQITRTYGDKDVSTFIQKVSLDCSSSDGQVNVENVIDWRTSGTLLKASFPLAVSNSYASYDLGMGVIERVNNHGSSDKRGRIPERAPISERPAVVDKRSRIGDWEGDTVSGKGHGSFVATHVERKTRYLLVGKMDDKSAASMNVTTKRIFRKIPKFKRKTLTVDNGKEFGGFKEMERMVGLCCYFADPYSSYQRGTNENTNGLLRQFFPKGTDFKKVSKAEIDKAVSLINNRPRKCLNYRTPNEMLSSG
ncbi:Transposase, IS30 family [Sedimentisphaera salicampi]|uniref:IS30 family transposase n=1 Tax=Sedimentisphaera salicampi TaxID=1941349 RepID=UPI000B9AE7C9|nr:IS30 family transposase [Sedimentisphaera salicampi]OXU15713.1 Transposase, IS30 family [Sedimentisphaera salicampi]